MGDAISIWVTLREVVRDWAGHMCQQYRSASHCLRVIHSRQTGILASFTGASTEERWCRDSADCMLHDMIKASLFCCRLKITDEAEQILMDLSAPSLLRCHARASPRSSENMAAWVNHTLPLKVTTYFTHTRHKHRYLLAIRISDMIG